MASIKKSIEIYMYYTIIGFLMHLLFVTNNYIFLYLFIIIKSVYFIDRITNIYNDNIDLRFDNRMLGSGTSICLRIKDDFMYLFKYGASQLIIIQICSNDYDNNLLGIIYLIFKMFPFEVIFDFFHYGMHRLLHSKYLYKYHKYHHTIVHDLKPIDTYKSSIVETIVVTILPMYMTNKIITLTNLEMCIFVLHQEVVELWGHTKLYSSVCNPLYHWIPELLKIELYPCDHYVHHTYLKCNYSKRFILWDKLFGTYKKTLLRDKQDNYKTNKPTQIITTTTEVKQNIVTTDITQVS